MKQINPPFTFGDRTFHGDRAVMVLRCEPGFFGWTVLVTPDDSNDTFWVGSLMLLPPIRVAA